MWRRVFFSSITFFPPFGLNLFRDFQINNKRCSAYCVLKTAPRWPAKPSSTSKIYFLFVSFLPSWTSDLDLLFNFLWTSDITIVVDLKLVIFHSFLYERFCGYSSSLFRCLSLLCLHLWCSVISWTLPFPHLPSAHINK